MIKAEADLRALEAFLGATGRPELTSLVRRLFHLVLTDLIESHTVSPVHHVTRVARNMAEILHGEGADAEEWRRGLAAALLHDVALGRTGEGRKIRKAEIEKLPPDEREAEIQAAIESRQSHMKVGAGIAARALQAYNAIHGATFSQSDIEEVALLIRIHDNPSIQEYDSLRTRPSGINWLFDSGHRLMKFLREADRLFMVSFDGVEVDLERDGVSSTAATRLARLAVNIRRHREEATLYGKNATPRLRSSHNSVSCTGPSPGPKQATASFNAQSRHSSRTVR